MSVQGWLARFELPASTFHVPSTAKGALKCRPLRKTPARANNGKPTRRMYATTKFRLVRDIETNLGEEVKRGSPAQGRASSKFLKYYTRPVETGILRRTVGMHRR